VIVDEQESHDARAIPSSRPRWCYFFIRRRMISAAAAGTSSASVLGSGTGGGQPEHCADTVTGEAATEAKGTSAATSAAERMRLRTGELLDGRALVRRASDIRHSFQKRDAIS
jgi:hypothetical protein